MYSKEDLSNFLYFDIETVPLTEDFYSLPIRLQEAWLQKYEQIKKYNSSDSEIETSVEENYFNNCSFYSEYSRVLCISCGILKWDNGTTVPTANIKTFIDEDERAVLSGFKTSLEKFLGSSPGKRFLCGHNIREFDVPFVARRLVINQILPLPPGLDLNGKKPWEVPHIDTLELWKFGDRKSYTKLDTLTAVLNIDSPKSEIDGSMVADVFYKEKDLPKLQRYCEADVVAVMQVMLRMSGLNVEVKLT